jgi:hypothetical protein
MRIDRTRCEAVTTRIGIPRLILERVWSCIRDLLIIGHDDGIGSTGVGDDASIQGRPVDDAGSESEERTDPPTV